MKGRDQRAELPIGTVLGESYRLLRRIADGGMGTVYEAEQLRLGKRCAVKVMAPELAASRDALARFHREVEITSQLNHPHIIQVLDFGSAPGGQPYLVMEYLEGEDLSQRLRRAGRLTPAAAVHIVKQVASALAATHAGGIVHRDLKPANVFLIALAGASEADADFVKVVDFGISKVKHAGPRLTRASVLMGTPQYMPPEQASGKIEAIDHRSDQWALAVIAWEMLAGRGPFQGKDVTALLYQIVHEDPLPVAARAAGLSPPVEVVLRRALSKRPRDRYGNITAFSRAFEAAVLTPAAAPAGARSSTTPGAGIASPWSLGTIFARRGASVPVDAAPSPPPPRTLMGPLAAAAASLVRSLRSGAPSPPAPAPPPPMSPLRTLLASVTPVHLWRGVRRRPRRTMLVLAAAGAAALVLLPSSWRRPGSPPPVAVDRPSATASNVLPAPALPSRLDAAVGDRAHAAPSRRTLRATTLRPMLVRAFCAQDLRQAGQPVRTAGFGREGCPNARARTTAERAILEAFTAARPSLLAIEPGGAAAARELPSLKLRRRRYAQLLLDDPHFRQTLMVHLVPALRAQGIDCPDCFAAR